MANKSFKSVSNLSVNAAKGSQSFLAGLLPNSQELSDDWPVYIFLFLSWFSTSAGLVGLIHGERAGFPLQTWLVIGLLIFGATLMMKRFLDRLLSADTWGMRITAFFGYLFLMMISIFFGFAFYWGQIEAREQTFGDAIAAIETNSTILDGKRAELNSIRDAYIGLANYSKDAYEKEFSEGYTCERGSRGGPGDGPRREFRRQSCVRFQGYATEVAVQVNRLRTGTSGEVPTPEGCNAPNVELDNTEKIDANLEALGAGLENVRELEADATSGDDARKLRQKKFDEINRLLREFESNFDILARGEIVAGRIDELNALADEYGDPNLTRRGRNSAGVVSDFKCPDEEFAGRLSRTAASLAALSATEISLEPLTAKDGAKATREAFDRLWNTMRSTLIPGQSVISPQRRETQLRAELRQALQEQEDGEENTARLRDLHSQLQEVLATKGRDGMMRGDDYPSLLIASIVDLMILFATLMVKRKKRWTFTGTSEDMEEYDSDEVLSPLMASRLTQEAEREVVEFKRSNDYSVQIGEERFIVEPLELSADDDIKADDKAIQSLIQILVLEGKTKRARMLFGSSAAKISQLLEAKESQAAGRSRYNLWRVSSDYWREVNYSAFQYVRDNVILDI